MSHDGHAQAGHGHADHGHAHGVPGPGHERRILWAMVLTGSFMLIEAVGGLVSGSLALIADAAHMLTDLAALVLAFAAFRFGRRPADRRGTYGYERFQVLAAFVNGLVLFVIAGWITIEATQRLFVPVEVLGGWMMAIALAGLAINVVAYLILRGGRGNLNMDGAMLHVISDLLGSVAAIAAAGVILLTGWTPADPLLSIVGVVLILRAGWSILAGSASILLERTPAHLPPERVEATVRTLPGVADVHHVHVWALTGERTIATLHVVLAPGARSDAVLAAVHHALAQELGIGHATVQIENDPCGTLEHAEPHDHAPPATARAASSGA